MRTTPMIVAIKTIIKITAIITLSVYAIAGFSETPTNTNSNIPTKGMTQMQVKNTFGEPTQTKPPVGKPAISRWDYSDYSVYFEGNYVIHSFRHSQRTLPLSATPSSKPAMDIVSEADEMNKASEEAITEMPDIDSPSAEATQTKAAEVKAMPQADSVVEESLIKKTTVEEAAVEEIAVKSKEVEKVEEQVKEEKDLNFEEPETKTDFGKWGY